MGAIRSLMGGCLFALCMASPLWAQGAAQATWVATWGAGMEASDLTHPPDFSAQTLRLIVHGSVGGGRARVWLSNRFGREPLRVGAAHLARSLYANPAVDAEESGILPGSDRVLTFHGLATVTIPVGATIVSDVVALEVPPLTNLAVSLYLPEPTVGMTEHPAAGQVSYVAEGNLAGETDLAGRSWNLGSWYVVQGVDVDAPGASSVVVLGDSIANGNHATQNANHRMPDRLAARLRGDEATRKAGVLGVVNMGISGGRVLLDGDGPSALARFDWDVLAVSGVRYLILFEGINDIEAVTHHHQTYGDIEARLEWALAQMAERAHERGIKVLGATQMTDCRDGRCASAVAEGIRNGLNEWIRTTPEFDGVVDFDRATRDPEHPSQMLPAYNSGDFVHPNDAGYEAMANAVDLALLAGKK
jgi:lysophospholipase L1-like esterase